MNARYSPRPWASSVGEGIDELTDKERQRILQMVLEQVVIDGDTKLHMTTRTSHSLYASTTGLPTRLRLSVSPSQLRPRNLTGENQ